ncbi:MAG: hypothetical protein IPN86_02520 [Saprospiraceae bacterium]|nr:hypothetical protein [Saprospiraceae bacterium]
MDGFKQGLITSGLNHAAHAAYKSLTEIEYSTANAKEMYKKVFGEIPSYTDIVADRSVPQDFQRQGYTIDDNFNVRDQIGSQVNGITDLIDINNCTSKIYLYRRAFASKGTLAMSLGHEMFHANLYSVGIQGYGRHESAIAKWAPQASLQLNSKRFRLYQLNAAYILKNNNQYRWTDSS